MASLRDIRNRIVVVGKTRKITRAMYLVSAAKMSRAQGAIVQARPYARKLAELMGAIAGGVEADAHALLAARSDPRRIDVVVFSSNRGLCGAYNNNVLKHAEQLVRAHRAAGRETVIVPVGRKVAEYFRRRKLGSQPRAWTDIKVVTPEIATEISRYLMGRFLSGETDEVVLVYSTFVSALTQRPGAEALLPMKAEAGASGGAARYEVEPTPAELLALLLPQAVEFRVFRALLEQQACEHAARMAAMDSATKNTEELTRSLTLLGNKVRQAAITAELVEIVSGAEAL